MKLLFDQNLSHRLPQSLSKDYPDSIHVRSIGLERASDDEIWKYAARLKLTIVSKDDDFHQRSFLFGHPPKVAWIGLGNCSTEEILDLLRRRKAEMERFAKDPRESFLALD